MMILASILLAVANWWWYFAFTNFELVLLSKLLSSIGGALNNVCLLRISQNWFAENQRATAVAIAAVVSSLGAGGALVFGPLFENGDRIINLNIKSCEDDFILEFNETDVDGDIECNDDAEDSFCCATPTDIEGLNLSLAILSTILAVCFLIFIFTS